MKTFLTEDYTNISSDSMHALQAVLPALSRRNSNTDQMRVFQLLYHLNVVEFYVEVLVDRL